MRFRLRASGLTLRFRYGRTQHFSWLSLGPFLLGMLALLAGVAVHWVAQTRVHGSMSLLERSSVTTRLAREHLLETVSADLERLLFTQPPPSSSPLPDYYLFMSGDELETLLERERRDRGWDQEERERVRAYFSEGGGQFNRVSVSARGYSFWHHMVEKPSFRLRFPRSGRSPGFRWLELQRPEDVLAIANLLPEKMGRLLGLLNGRIEPVRLNLNRSYMGVYLRNFRPGERLALENGVLPGIFFKGDKPNAPSIWTTHQDWSIFGETTPEVLAQFDNFLNLLGRDSFTEEEHRLLSELLDFDQYAAYTAVAVAVSSNHVDDRHNQSFYLSTYRGKLQPVIWDFNGLGITGNSDSPVNIINNRLQYKLYTDPEFVHKRNLALWKLLNTFSFVDQLEEHFNRLKGDLMADPAPHELYNFFPFGPEWQGAPQWLLGRPHPRPHSVLDVDAKYQEKKKWLEERKIYLTTFLQDAKVSVRPGGPNDTMIAVSGNVAVRLKQQGTVLYPALADHGQDFTLPLPKQVGRPAPFFYRLPISMNELQFENAVTGGPVTIVEEFPQPDQRSITRRPQAPQPERPLTLGPGPVRLTKDVVLDPQTTLIVRAGTSLSLDPGVGLYARGKVLFEGTKEEPITVTKSGDEPFAAFALSGQGTAGSSFRHTTFSGGSTGRLGMSEFKGMFDVYGCPDLTLENCTFEKSEIGDDIVNLALSRIQVKDCTFQDAPFDGLDLDGCSGKIQNSRFLRCGNDGLDVMEADVTVTNGRFEDCGDKGISVGEESRMKVSDCSFLRCVTGYEAKDASRSVLTNALFSDCRTGLHAYRKKFVFRLGGEVELVDSKFSGCEQDVDIAAYSKLWLNDSEPRVEGGSEMRVVTGGVFRLGDGPSVKP